MPSNPIQYTTPNKPDGLEQTPTPLVSVILPAYNSEKFIVPTIESVLNQTYKHVEIIVVDDGSSDQTAELVKGFGDRVKYIFQPGSGTPSSPRNTGIRAAKGEFITFLDADDILMPEKLEDQVEFLLEHPHITIAVCDYINFSDNGFANQSQFQICSEWYKLLQQREPRTVVKADTVRTLIVDANFITTVSIMVRSSNLLPSEKFFDESLAASVDYDFFYRICLRHDLGVINKIGFHRRQHGENLTCDSYKVNSNKIQSRIKLLSLEPIPDIQKKIKKFLSNCYYSLSHYYYHRGDRKAYQALWASFKYRRNYSLIVHLTKIILSSLKVMTPKQSDQNEFKTKTD